VPKPSPSPTKGGRQPGVPFRRVDEDKYRAVVEREKDLRLRNNTYEATFGSDGWGKRANDRLATVKGRDFRHEKTKKKRGSYRGGKIDFSVNSIQLGEESD
jgi:nucleolin